MNRELQSELLVEIFRRRASNEKTESLETLALALGMTVIAAAEALVSLESKELVEADSLQLTMKGLFFAAQLSRKPAISVVAA